MFSFLDTNIPGCTNFKWGEALYLPQWEIHAYPPDEIIDNILAFAPKAQKVRNFLDEPMVATSWWRPKLYNKEIKGSKKSWHMTGGALDFRGTKSTPDEIREKLEPKLEEFGLRMEKLPGASWVHIDDKEPGNARYFIP